MKVRYKFSHDQGSESTSRTYTGIPDETTEQAIRNFGKLLKYMTDDETRIVAITKILEYEINPEDY